MTAKTAQPAQPQSLFETPAAEPCPEARTRCTVDLRILATTDLHMSLLPWDYLRDRPQPGQSLAELAPLLEQARQEVPNCLLFDNGDFLQGTALGDHLALMPAGPDSPPHPMIAAMSALGYDAVNLGNHDFSHGLPFLAAALGQARFPVLATNTRPNGPDAAVWHGPHGPAPIAPWTVLARQVTDRDGQGHLLRIGVLGVLPPQTMHWEHGHLAGRVEMRDILTSATKALHQMRAAGAEVIIALCHSGIAGDLPAEGQEIAAVPLAALPEIDAVIAGHTHRVFPSDQFAPCPAVDPLRGTLSGKPAVMAGAQGSHLGVIDLQLVQGADRRWQVGGFAVACRKTPADAGAHLPLPMLAQSHRAALDWVRQPIGWTETGLDSAFALVTPGAAHRLVARAQARHVAQALRDGPLGRLPILSAVAPFRTGGRAGPDHYVQVDPGPVLLRHVLMLYPHPNALVALRLSGAELQDWLERAVGIYRQISPGAADQPLIDPDFAPFNFDMIDGVEFRIDLSQPARHDAAGTLRHPQARRIRELTWQGQPVTSDQTFILATNSYRAAGGMGFAGADPANVVLADGTALREVLAAHLRAQGTTLPPAAPAWRFLPLPGTSVLFDTQPAARDRAGQHPHLALEPLAETPDGFLRFRLRL